MAALAVHVVGGAVSSIASMNDVGGAATGCRPELVSCPPRARLPARNGLVNEVEFLGLFLKMVEDQ